MKKLKGSTGAKVIAILLCFITLVLTVGSAVAIALLADHGFYTTPREAILEEQMTDILVNNSTKAVSYYNSAYSDPEHEFKYTNFFYTIKDDEGRILSTNYNDEDVSYTYTASVYYTDTYGLTLDEKQNSEIQYSITSSISRDLKYKDTIYYMSYGINTGYAWRYGIIAVGIASLISNILIFAFLMCAAGHRKGKDEIVPNIIDKIPFDLYTLILVAIACIQVTASGSGYFDTVLNIIITGVFVVIDFLLCISYCMSFATRIKTGGLFKKTLIFLTLKFIWKCLKAIGRAITGLVKAIPLIWKTLLVIGGVWIMSIILTVSIYRQAEAAILFLFFALFCASIIAIIVTLNMKSLKKAGERISYGDLTYVVDTRNMFFEFKKHGEALNSISKGMSKAVDERMKSEHFKTELITNVSHDLKTPLTSIINYIDLIKKEDLDNETLKGYVEVLERQSARLKKLTEDLVEASKASTGNLKIEAAPCELGVMLAQTVGEYDEKLKDKDLELVINKPDDPVSIMADGKYLWRIFDNLMNNICKYAQPSTRVYLDLEVKNHKAFIVFRNISHNALNVPGDELMERFVRGDSARNTEGSGLGLSIAKSLAELQKGKMNIIVDGDLFKLVLIFDII